MNLSDKQCLFWLLSAGLLWSPHVAGTSGRQSHLAQAWLSGSKECGWAGFTKEGLGEAGMVAQPSTDVAVGIEETPNSDFPSFSFANACLHSFKGHEAYSAKFLPLK